MIENCNFKHKDAMGNIVCVVGNINHKKDPFYYYECDGEENCVVFQTYKVLSLLSTDYCQRIEDIRKTLIEKGLLKEEKKAPEKKVEMRQKMREFADKHNLIINPYAEAKIEWMEKHGRRCHCEPDGSRICPCKFCLKDIKEFNGCCLCRVFVTEDKMKRIEKYQKQKS